MTRLYLDMAHVSAIPDAYRMGSAGLMAATGINIGNFAFRHALPRILAEFDSYTPVTYSAYMEVLRAGTPVERVLVSCANWLGSSEADEKNNGFRAMALEQADAPVDCFGLGVQAAAGCSRVELGPNTRRMARIMSERARAISVRDQLTQDTLERCGILNTVVTGCPSNFINPDPDLGARIIARAAALAEAQPGWDSLRTLISEASTGHAASGEVIRASLGLMARHPVFYALQTPDLLPLLLGESDRLPEAYLRNSPAGQEERLKQTLSKALLHFSSIDAWMDFARSCQLSFGMRIHGTMVPLQAGVPSLLIRHDSRTAGLAKHMSIPAIGPEDFVTLQARGPGALLHRIAQQMGPYDARRKSLAATLQDYVTGNGLRPHAALRALAGAPAAEPSVSVAEACVAAMKPPAPAQSAARR